MSDPPIAKCKDRTLIPALPTTLPNIAVFLFFLLYCFFGIAVITDVIICAIQRITSTMKKVKKVREKHALVEGGFQMPPEEEDGEEFEYVKVWNPTVANLTLMALGSSASEILLSCIEVIGGGFEAGDLGPGTIVGSAAFNLFTISAICVVSVKSPTVKRIENITVFYISAAFSVLAYVWLYVILVVSSPDVVEVWEAALTLSFLVVLVCVAYAVDIKWWRKFVKKAAAAKPEENGNGIENNGDEGEVEERRSINRPVPPMETVREMQREVARSYPNLSPEDQAKIIAYRINQTNTPHDRMYYRIKAIRQMTSSWRESKTEQEVVQFMTTIKKISVEGRVKPRIEWSARSYGVKRGDRTIKLTIVRRGSASHGLSAAYQTVNGTAKKDQQYLDKKESVQFHPGERSKAVDLQLIDTDDWKPDTLFYVHLKIKDQISQDRTKLGKCDVARVRFFDDANVDPLPAVEFAKENHIISENDEWVRLYIRSRSLPLHDYNYIYYETEDETAEAEYDYVSIKNGQLCFEPGEIEKYVDIEIITDNPDQDDETFAVKIVKINEQLMQPCRQLCAIITLIASDRAIQNLRNMRRLMHNYLRDMQLHTTGQSWKEQIINACSVNGGDTANATLADALKHAFAFPWKMLTAFVPPPELFAGWPCFLCALSLIGGVTAVVGDVASILGCMLGIGDAVTATTLVALGTSLPDTFASKIAAEQDDTADSAVGSITGCNSVNVFLGLGLPWFIAAIYWACKGKQFRVEAGDLAHSVSLFTLLSLVCIAVFTARRLVPCLGQGELGGRRLPKFATGLLLFSLWIVYVVVSTAHKH